MDEMDERKLAKLLECSHLTKFILAECAPADNKSTFYYEKVLENLSGKLNLTSIVTNDNLTVIIDQAIENNCQYIEWLCTGIAALYSFIQCNFTGPEVSETIVGWLVSKREEAHKFLALEDQCNENVTHLELLYFAKSIFSNRKLQKTCETTAWWLMRANYIHQLILDETSGSILKQCEELIDKMIHWDLWTIVNDQSLETMFHVEAANFWLLYKRINNCEYHLNRAQSVSNLSVELEGAMGKRTKFQQDAKPQLFLRVKTKQIYPHESCPDLPASVNLNDDLRLERINFLEEIEQVKLGTYEESIILGKSLYLQICQPKDNLADEEIVPHLETVIESTNNWALKMEALRQRSVLEMKDKRGIERALSQTESLIGQYCQSKPSVFHRTYFLFASGMKPIWVFKQNLADAMLSLGMAKSALELYLQLHLWEEVIVCYTILDLHHKTAEIIKQEIGKKPSVKLWCLLGDTEQNVNHYETAWKLSEEKSSRVQRHWGMYYFTKKNYSEAIPHLHLSVELNNIQESVWIRLGFAALQVEDWKLAAKAYRRYCELEQTSFEAWNNLAKAYIKLGDKSRAFSALQDAVKCNYEKWEVWDNLMIVSIDLNQFFEVIKCYHRILDLKGKHVDVEVLRVLTKSITEQMNDSEMPESNEKLHHKTLELFGRLTALVHNNPDIWRLYAQLTALHKTDLDCQKAALYLQRAYRASVADPTWRQTVESIKNVLELCQSLAQTYLQCVKNASIGQKRSMLGSAKLSLQSVISNVKQVAFHDSQEVRQALEKLENLLKDIVIAFDEVKAQ